LKTNVSEVKNENNLHWISTESCHLKKTY